MGFLEYGTPLSWAESAQAREYVKLHGLEQLLSIYKANVDRSDEELFWGDEVELFVSELASDSSNAAVVLEADSIIESLELREKLSGGCRRFQRVRSSWHPEFGNHMIEALPLPAYTLMNLDSIHLVEPSMRLRRTKIQAALEGRRYVNSLAVFPRFGLPGSFTGASGSNNRTGSIFIPDHLPSPHPRFITLVENIRARRKALPFITIPLFKDEKTYSKPIISSESNKETDWCKALPKSQLDRFTVMELAKETINPVKDFIYMDCFAFGMGQSCLQVTFGTHNIGDARHLYDQFAVLAPLFLPLTAASPFARGLLASTDTRWATLEQAVDCRTQEEELAIPKSRYSNVSLYLSNRDEFMQRSAIYNDSHVPVSAEAKQHLLKNGMDESLAQHFAHLWIRDPIVIFTDRLHLDDSSYSDHFENLQSTNWNSVRFKPPPPPQEKGKRSDIGWRVEFRTPEVQLTDFENAACAALLAVLARVIVERNLDFYIPMSMNDANMQRGWKMDAITTQKFYFRRNVFSPEGFEKYGVTEMSLEEILCGMAESPRCSSDSDRSDVSCDQPLGASISFPGLLPLALDFIREKVDMGECSESTEALFSSYCKLFEMRTKGLLSTSAQFLRRFVLQHPHYKRDSVITSSICHDLNVLAVNIGFGLWLPEELFGDLKNLVPRMPLQQETHVPTLSKAAMTCSSFVAFVRPQSGCTYRPLPPVVSLSSHLQALQNHHQPVFPKEVREETPPRRFLPSSPLPESEAATPMTLHSVLASTTVDGTPSAARSPVSPAEGVVTLQLPSGCVPSHWPVMCSKCGRRAVFAISVRAQHPLKDFTQIYQMGPRRVLCGASCKQVYPNSPVPTTGTAAAAVAAQALGNAAPAVQAAAVQRSPTVLAVNASEPRQLASLSTAGSMSGLGGPAAAGGSNSGGDLEEKELLDAFPKNEELALRWLRCYADARTADSCGNSCGGNSACIHAENEWDPLKQIIERSGGWETASTATASGLEHGEELEDLVDSYSRCVSLGYHLD